MKRVAGLLSRSSYLTGLVVFVAFCVVAGVRHHNFLQPSVFWNIVRDNAFLGIVAIGETFVILSGGIDLSVGSMIGLTSVGMSAMIGAHVSPPLAALICLVLGGLFGAAMGKVIATFSVPPFLVTLAGLFMARGLAYMVTTESQVISNPLYDKLSQITWLSPLVFGLVVLFAHVLLHFRPFGRCVYAIGGSENSAALMGLETGRTKVWLYVVSAVCAVLGGIVYTLYTVSGDPNAGQSLELDAIAAVVIGGTLLTGGAGGVLGTVVGVMLLGAIQTELTFENDINSWWTRIIVGSLLLVFLLIQRGVGRRLATRVAS